MGYYSFTCAKTGLPAVANDSGCDPKFYRVVILTSDGSALRGEYNGYGRVGRFEEAAINVGGEAGDKLVLEHFYRGESYAQLGTSGSDPDQGAFDPLLHPAMLRAQEDVPGFDGRQYRPRLGQWHKMRAAAYAYLAGVYGVTPEALEDFGYAMARAEFESPAGARHSAAMAWSDLSGGGAGFPDGHALHGKTPEETQAAIQADRQKVSELQVQELMAAWIEGRPVREPDFDALRRGEPVWFDGVDTQDRLATFERGRS